MEEEKKEPFSDELPVEESECVTEIEQAPASAEESVSGTEEAIAEAEVPAEPEPAQPQFEPPMPESTPAQTQFVPPMPEFAPQPTPVLAAKEGESGFTAFLHKLFPPDEKLRNGHIVFNLLAVVIALVCGFSCLFAPIVSIDLGAAIGSALEVMNDVTEDGGMSESDGENSADDSTFAFLGAALEGVSESLKGKRLTVSAMTLWTAGNSDDPLGALGLKLLEENKEIIEEATITVATGTLVSVGAEEYINNLPEEEQAAAREALADVDYDRLTNAMLELNGSDPANKEETVDTLVDTFTDELSGVIGELSEENKEELKAQISEFYDYGITEEGTFDMEQMICTSVGSMMGGTETITGYADLLQLLMNGGVTGGGSSNGEEEGSTGFAAMAEDSFDGEIEEDGSVAVDSVGATVGVVLKGVSVWFFAVSGVWFLLAALAFLHIFLKKRKFFVWYAIAFGGSPALIWVLLTALPSAMDSLLSVVGVSELSGIGGILGAISSGMWIVELCYLLTIVLSIVMMPYHKKMKAEAAAKEAAKRWQNQFVQPV